MIQNLTIKVLVDNTASGKMLAEHGLSFYIEADDKKILFDTGQGNVIRYNLKKMKIDLSGIDSLVLSHGHYDHTGGIPEITEFLPDDLNVYAHPGCFNAKYAVSGGGYDNPESENKRYIGISQDSKTFLQQLRKPMNFINHITEIAPDIFLTGEIPRNNQFENVESRFRLEDMNHDEIVDDQAIFFRTRKGTVVLTGCCHSGMGNTLEYVADYLESEKIYGIIGGLHLKNADSQRIDYTLKMISKYKLNFIAPCHCTGMLRTAEIYRAFPNIFAECSAGTSFKF